MSKALSDLRRLITRSTRISQGSIIAVNGQILVVSASEVGEKAFHTPNPGAYAVGDRVRFQGDILIGKTKSDSSVPTYSV